MARLRVILRYLETKQKPRHVGRESMNGTDAGFQSPTAEPPVKNQIWQIAFWLTIFFCVISTMAFAPWFPSRIELYRLAFLSPMILLCCLIGAYAGFGRSILRWVVVLILAGSLGWYATISAGSPVFVVLVFGIVGVTLATTMALRIWKGSLIRTETCNPAPDGLQFGIRHLMIGTTVAAVLLAIGKAIWNNPLEPNRDILWILVGLPICFGIATVVNIWALFGKTNIAPRLLVVVAVTLLSALGCYLLVPEIGLFAEVAIIHQIHAVALMFMLRRQGFRFVKRNDGAVS